MFPIYLIFTLCVCVSSQWLNDYANVNGVKLWSATVNAPATTVTHLGNIPTLVYNCAIVPSLCQTAEHAGRLGAATGNYPHGQEAFGWDPNSNRKSSRRKNACPDNWKKKSKLDPDGHACPEDNQPPVHPIGYTNVVPPLVDQPSYAILRLNPQTQVPEKTGLMYTCDEFPPAMSVQGGNGTDQAPNVGRDTYCATQSHDCSSTLWETAIPTIHGEQDWQRSAHQFLSSHVGTDRLHIWEYYFKTVRINSNVATWVEWVPPGASRYEYEDWYGSKRDIMSPRKVISGVGTDNGVQHYWVPDEHTSQSFLEFYATQPEHIRNFTYTIEPSMKYDDWEQEDERKRIRRENKSIRKLLARNRSLRKHSKISERGLQSRLRNDTSKHAIVQQNIAVAPALPILKIGLDYILGNMAANITGRNRTPISHVNNTLPNSKRSDSLIQDQGTVTPRAVEGPVQCGVGKTCADGSCCNSDGKCGFQPYHCHPTAPVKCLSNCDATAMCGINSAGGKLKCGLNLCCSYYGWCGTESVHCVNSDPQGGTAPCQKSFGGCTIVPPPSCGKGSGTAAGRKIAYYQSWNVRQRNCNRVSPKQINTTSLTHLNFAFASIDPASFKVVPMYPDDVTLYPEFTALKSSTLKTWIAIGGFDFSDPGPTHTTWSSMCSTSANRAAFISSLVAFMDKYGFQGADLDWEYPASDARGGRPEDTANLVSLVKEMRAAFGTKYGISSILAPDYWYLRGMDPKGMDPYVDFFGFMAYDLHGFWDADVKTLGSILRPQTDIREIQNDTLPLWFDKLTPSKVNLGLAYYGRGYTVSDPKCAYPGCKFAGPSKAGPCTGFDGVMSNREIQALIKAKGLVPEYLKDPKIKQISWDDQWIGYDDDQTFADKIAFANDQCMGGTMIWSIDFNSGAGSGDIPDGGGSTNGGGLGTGTGSGLVSVDAKIWSSSTPQVQCVPPCVLVLPPIPLASPSIISFAPFTTSYIMQTTIVSGGQTKTTQTARNTTIKVPPVTTTEIELWGVTVFSNDPTVATFTAVQSVTPLPFVVTLPGSATFPPFARPTTTITGQSPPASTSTPAVIFPSSHTVTLQPQPTFTISTKPIPPLTYTSGKPKSTCISHCGKHSCRAFGCGGGCQLFGCGRSCGLFGCGGGCGLFGCGGGCGIFGCGGGCGLKGCGSQCPGCGPGPPPDGGGEDHNDDDDDDGEDDALCLLQEADIDDTGIVDIEGTTGVPSGYQEPGRVFVSTAPPPPRSTVTKVVIVPAPTPDVPPPPPNPEPPRPNPDTEKNQCFDGGSWADRADVIEAVKSFCSSAQDADPKWRHSPHYGGYTLKNNEFVRFVEPANLESGWPVDIIISIQALNGCEFTIDGPAPNQECGRILRRVIDRCDTVSGEARKQGGKVTSNCAVWSLDMAFNGDILVDDVCDAVGGGSVLCAA